MESGDGTAVKVPPERREVHLSLCGILLSNDGLLACFCHKLTFNQTGGFDHSVFDTFVQLTEGRSARDQPKQPPAKKNLAEEPLE